MKTRNGFTLIEKPSEIGEYLRKQSVSRKITRLQVHHMDLPNYDTWEKTDKKVFSEPHFGRTESLDDYGKRTWNSKSANGKYIAQHFNVFPDGKITTGRSLNSTPIGIKGWNTNAICIEIYGDFDKGKDVMNKAQKEAIIALYGELCKKFDLTPNSNNIRCHCWFTSTGTYLDGYYPSRSAKTCPGTEFTEAFGGLVNGYGNSKDAFNKYFYPAIENYLKNGIEDNIKEEDKTPVVPKPDKPTVMPGKYIVRYLQQCLNENYGCKLAIDGSFGPATQSAVNKNYLNKGDKGEHVIWLQKALCNRGFKVNVDGSFGPATLTALKKYQKSRGLTADGCGGKATHKAIIND